MGFLFWENSTGDGSCRREPSPVEFFISVLIEKRRIKVTFCRGLLEYNEPRDYCLHVALHMVNVQLCELP